MTKTSGRTLIKVLFVSHDGGMAGAQRTLQTLLTNIDRSRFIPYLLVPNQGKLSLVATEMGIQVFVRQMIHWVPGVNALFRSQRLSYFLRSFKTLRARSWAIAHLIEEHQIDLVYTNTVTCIEGAIAARMTDKPHIWHIHESITGNSELIPLLPFPLYSLIVRALSKTIIFCSVSLARTFPLLKNNNHIVYNGLKFPAPINRKYAHDLLVKNLEIEESQKIVAIVSALQPRKDHRTFLATAHEITSKYKDVVFLIAGEGAEVYTKKIKRKIELLNLAPSVKLIGWWPEDNIYDLLAGVDVLVVSSEQESFGLTIIEALAMETPVVSTRCGGPEEVIVDRQTGLLVPLKDPESMAKAIIKLLQNPQLACEIGQAGRNDVLSRFSVKQYCESIQQILEQSLSQNQ
ncbi:glycosyltransferase [Methylomonas sp. MK1]|uniref:glycosyltransferase n=1 Tax=Methylomonas sp. MK1 TaxID=1131552 RepID=UPI00039B2771|nr:glycosyltransferase [Methylomonas sp. MK1]